MCEPNDVLGPNDVFVNIATSPNDEENQRAHFNMLLFYCYTFMSLDVFVDMFPVFAVDELRQVFIELLPRSCKRRPLTYLNIMYYVYGHYRNRIINLDGTVCRIDSSTFQELLYMAIWATTYGPPTRMRGGADMDMQPLCNDLKFTETVWNSSEKSLQDGYYSISHSEEKTSSE